MATPSEWIQREQSERIRLRDEDYTQEQLIQFLAAGTIRQRKLEADLTARDGEIRGLTQHAQQLEDRLNAAEGLLEEIGKEIKGYNP